MWGQATTFPIDHVIPRILNGSGELDNLALACFKCNARKWAHVDGFDPEANQVVRLFNPRIDHWAEHFRWSDSRPGILEGLSSVGRATISRLDMNDPELIAARRFWAELEAD
jgi:hypothetical protein